jgi:hypothetical protein
MKNRENFLVVLKQSEIERLLPQGDCAGTASQAVKPGGAVHANDMEFGFATGIECSNPTIGGENGKRIRRDLLDECGHYRHWREDLQLVKDMCIPFLCYGLPNHQIHLGHSGQQYWIFSVLSPKGSS